MIRLGSKDHHDQASSAVSHLLRGARYGHNSTYARLAALDSYEFAHLEQMLV